MQGTCNSFRALIVILLLIAHPALAASSAGNRVRTPETLTREGADRPFFIAASAAAGRDGSLQWSLFDPFTRFEIQSRLETQRHRASLSATASDRPSFHCAATALG